ncbi:MAG: hypothetical protein GX932_04680, partial [Methanomicrobiales archaeon]|nr:hypothetical protein [Methanomicrobiales archaeon]
QVVPDEARLLVDEEEEPIALALHDEEGWHAASFLFREPTLPAIECFEAVGGDIYQESREAWLSAVREYYSTELSKTTFPALEDLRPDREGKIRDLLDEVWGDRAGTPCLDCCCGSGVGTAALRAGGVRALAYDNDPGLLALGLSKGRLAPSDTMCIDAQKASRYIDPVPLGAAFMVGEIYSYNTALWRSIVANLLALTDETLITVGTEEEAARVEEWCTREGRTTEVFENRRDPLYDRWCCVAQRT